MCHIWPKKVGITGGLWNIHRDCNKLRGWNKSKDRPTDTAKTKLDIINLYKFKLGSIRSWYFAWMGLILKL